MLRMLIFATALMASAAVRADDNENHQQLNEKTVAQLQAMMASGELSSVELTKYYLARIHALDENGPAVNSVIELNPDALAMAKNADRMREKGKLLGPLHGLPVLLKDNIDTGDKMQTTAGSFALVGKPALQDSTVAAKLRAGGAVILGKTNLSEWANFRSFESFSGWSGRGGQTHNAYFMDHNPCGSSSGSAAAVSANFAAVSFGTETDGSIVCPGNANGVVAIKPTVGLTSRAGVVPISHVQDTVGPHARTVADAAAALSVIQSRSSDGRDAATGDVPLGWRGVHSRPATIPTDYTKFLDANGLKGARIGITRAGLAGFTGNTTPPSVTAAVEAAFAALSAAGAIVIDLDAAGANLGSSGGELLVLIFDFRRDLNAYLATRQGVPVKNFDDVIAYNNAHAKVEMPFFTQDIFLDAATFAPGENDPQKGDPLGLGLDFGGLTYNQALDIDHQAGVDFDAAMAKFNLDAVVSATDNPAWATDFIYGDHFLFGTSSYAAGPGYPIVQVPAGNVFGVPLGISFFGTAFSEGKLIKLASGYEAATQERAKNPPQLLQHIPDSSAVEPPLTAKPGSDGARSASVRAVPARKETLRQHHL